MAVTVSAKALGNMSLNSFKDRNVQKVNEEGVLGGRARAEVWEGLGSHGSTSCIFGAMDGQQTIVLKDAHMESRGG